MNIVFNFQKRLNRLVTWSICRSLKNSLEEVLDELPNKKWREDVIL